MVAMILLVFVEYFVRRARNRKQLVANTDEAGYKHIVVTFFALLWSNRM